VFAEEAHNVNPNYKPDTVNIDGWDATRIAFNTLFVSIVIIRCFLHAFIKIRDCTKKHPKANEIYSKIWKVYHSPNKRTFSQRLRRLKNWAVENLPNTTALEKIEKTYERSTKYQIAYDHPDCHRTSNMCDRLMRTMDRSLFVQQMFHGTLASSTEMIRSWAIYQNYYPFCMKKLKVSGSLYCRAGELNGFHYSDNWLHNLVVASSMNGYRQ
jgi:hypothetical protein